jgi:hypothetical protein
MRGVQVKQKFKPVPGHEMIFAGDWGDIYTMKGKNVEYSMPRKLNQNNVRGYKKVYIKGKDYFVHRLVMAAHVGVCDAPVNHKDGKKDNNYIENLEYCTHRYNSWHYHNVTKPNTDIDLPAHVVENIECHLLGTNLTVHEIAVKLRVYASDVEKVQKKLDKC